MASLRAKADLLKGLLHGEAAFGGPFWVGVEATRRCNTFCAGCHGRSHLDRGAPGRPDISLDLVHKICEGLPPLGTREICLAGLGEPLLHPRIFDVIAAFKRAGLRIQMFSNGIVLEEHVARSIVESGLDDLHVTVWATDSRQYAALHPGTNPAHLEKRIEGISKVIDARRACGRTLPRVHFQAPLNRANCTGVDVRVRHAIQTGCDSLRFGYYRHFGREFENLCLTPEDLEALDPALRKAKRDLRAAGLAENVDVYRTLLSLGRHVWRRTPCHAGWVQTNVLADGKVQACSHCDVIVGDLSTQSFPEIWHGREFRNFRRTVSRPGGAAAYGRLCECEDCCQMKDNLSVHRIFRWLAPLARLTRTPERQ